jgi:hypothetical protein
MVSSALPTKIRLDTVTPIPEAVLNLFSVPGVRERFMREIRELSMKDRELRRNFNAVQSAIAKDHPKHRFLDETALKVFDCRAHSAIRWQACFMEREMT